MRILKSISQYICIFSMALALLLGLLLATMLIPRGAIFKNLKESTNYFKERKMVDMISHSKEYTYFHTQSDAVLLNIIACVDSDNVLESAMWDKYYNEKIVDTNKNFVSVIEDSVEPNTQYLRYWHGSMIFLRPLLLIFSFQEIVVLNEIVFSILSIAFLIVLFKKSKKIAIIYFISMIMIAYPIVCMSPYYSCTFYIMMITSLIAIKIEKYGDNGLFKLFFITGMVTCFFDFLTTEIITLYIPLLIIIFIRKERSQSFNFKENFIFFLKASLLWICSYAFMYCSKWLLASIILHIDSMEYVIDYVKLRINGGTAYDIKNMYSKVIERNFFTLYPFNDVKEATNRIMICLRIISVFIAFVNWRRAYKNPFFWLMIFIALIPYARYLIIANHSFRHYFFTFREQMITILALGMLLIDNFAFKKFLNKNILKKILR